jgi:hypothetical protein
LATPIARSIPLIDYHHLIRLRGIGCSALNARKCALKLMTWTKAKITVVAGIAIVLIAIGIEMLQASTLLEQNQQLQRERDDARNRLASLTDEMNRSGS